MTVTQTSTSSAPTPATSPSAAASSRPRYRREDIIAAACALLNEGGLASLTMRRLATHLDVQPSALYWHFADKQTLLAAMSSHILAAATPEASAPIGAGAALDEAAAALPWEDRIRRAAAEVRACLMDYTDGAELVSSSLALGRVQLPLRAQCADALRTEGTSEAVIDLMASTLGHYVVGATFHEQQRQSMSALDATSAEGSDQISHERALQEQADREFAQGVELIIAGTAVLLSMGAGA